MATDITDPVVLITLAQTVVLTITMIIFIFQFRSQDLAVKDSAYQKALDDYTDSVAMLVEKPELGSLVDEIGRLNSSSWESRAELSPQDRAQFGYMLLEYSLFERVYLLYAKKWIDEDTWSQWYTWMKTMAKHQKFQEIHERSQGTFDKKFQDLVEKAIKAP